MKYDIFFLAFITLLFLTYLTVKTLFYPRTLEKQKKKFIFVKSFLFLTTFITIPAYFAKLIFFDFTSLDFFSWLFNPFFLSYFVFLGFYSIFMRELFKEFFIIQQYSKFNIKFIKTYLREKILTKEYIKKVYSFIMYMVLVRIFFEVLLYMDFFSWLYDCIIEHNSYIKVLIGYTLPMVLFMGAPGDEKNSLQYNGYLPPPVIWVESQGVLSRIEREWVGKRWVWKQIFWVKGQELKFWYNDNKDFENLELGSIKFNFWYRQKNLETIDIVLDKLRQHPNDAKLNQLPEECKRYIEHLISVSDPRKHSYLTHYGEKKILWARLSKGLERDPTTIWGIVAKEKKSILEQVNALNNS